jgi:excisionase family DNA binding protein
MKDPDSKERATFTIEEAAEVLGISRGVAYKLARDFVNSNGEEGLPVLRMGKRMVVPHARLDKMLTGN